MMIVWGTKLYGQVEKVPGLGHIATEFGHLMFMPLFPTQSYFVLEEDMQTFQAIPIGISGKSVLAGYGFPYSILMILAGFGAFGALNDPHIAVKPEATPGHFAMIVLGAICVPLLLAMQTKWFRNADHMTASNMAAMTGDDRVQVFVDHHFDKITDQEADERIEAIEAAGFNQSEYSMPQDAGVPMYVPTHEQSTVDSYHHTYALGSQWLRTLASACSIKKTEPEPGPGKSCPCQLLRLYGPTGSS